MELIQNDFMIDTLRISPTRNLLIGQNDRFQIEPRIMDVLCVLSQNARNVVSREAFIEQIWKVEFGGDESLTRAISLLRKTFQKAGLSSKLIETIPKRGYRLAIDIHESALSSSKQRKTLQVPVSAQPQAAQPPSPAATASEPSQTVKIIPTILPQKAMNVSQLSANTPPIASTKSTSKLSGALLLVPVLVGAIFIGWLMGQKSNDAPKTTNAVVTAAQDLPEAIKLEADLSNAEIAMAILTAYDEGNIGKESATSAAERYLQKAQKENPNSVTTLSAQAWLRYHQNNLQDSLVLFEKAIVEDPIHGNAWLGKARVLKATDNYELAMVNADQAINLDSLSFAARLLRAEILAAQSKMEDARVEIDELLRLNSQFPKALKFQERLTIFTFFDANEDGKLFPGDIGDDDAPLHLIQDQDGAAGISIGEFSVRGEASLDMGTSEKTLFQYDLSDPKNPKFRKWNQAE